MNNVENLIKCAELPLFYSVQYKISREEIRSAAGAIIEALKRPGTLDRIMSGQTVAITAGSREISHLAEIIATLVSELKRKGAKPFIVPAMGSHGGATAEGQREMIAQFGITEAAMGVPIISSMETAEIAVTASGIPVHVDKQALQADHIIPVGRIKPHTDFKGPYESGLMKMLAIGLGKQHGASICHKLGMPAMSENVFGIGQKIIETLSVPFGIGIIENAFHGTWKIAAVPGECIMSEEPELLQEAKAQVPLVPFAKIDILVCEEMGKDISGTGMDSNVIGRSASLGISRPFAERIGVFALTEKSHGNANGMGLADSITRRFFNTIDLDQTYPNAITSAETTAVKIPAIMASDELCVQFLIKTCTGSSQAGLRMVWIRNTLSLDEFYISEGLLSESRQHPDLQAGRQAYAAVFDRSGMFTGFEPIRKG